jgi:hypothetical protein
VTKRSRSPAKPHAKKKSTREKAIRESAPSDGGDKWADDIWKQLLDGAHPVQYDAATDPAARYSLLWGRGATKTTTFRIRGVRKLTKKRGAKVLYFASTRGRAVDLMWLPLKTLLHRLGFVEGVDVTFNESQLRCTVHRTGSMYQFSGLQDIKDADKWRGDTFDEVQFDECGSIDPDLLEYTIFQVIGPRVRCLGLGGTPGLHRRKIFYDVTRPGCDKHRPYKDRDKAEYKNFKGYSSHHLTLKQIVELPGAKKKYPALVELYELQLEEFERNQWSPDNPIRKREYDAIWAADGTLRVFDGFRAYHDETTGKFCNAWDPFDGKGLIEGIAGLKVAVAKLKQTFPEFKDWRFVVAKDMGHKDPFACTPWMFSPHDPKRRKWQVMSLEQVGMYAKPIAELLIGAEVVDKIVKENVFPTDGKYGGVFGVTGWPDAMVMDADHATLEELKNVYGIQTTKADKKPEYKKGAIELVNGEFTDERLYVILNSPMHEQLEALQWKEQLNGVLIEDPAQANHSTDTAVYGCREVATLFESGRVATDAKPQAPQSYQDPMGLGPPGIGSNEDADDDSALLAPSEWSEDDDW